jgi:HEAT repeat protein
VEEDWRSRLWQAAYGARRHLIPALEAAGELAGPNGIPDLGVFLYFEDVGVRAAATGALAKVLQRAQPADVLQFPRSIQDVGHLPIVAREWRLFRPERLAAFDSLEGGWAALAYFTLHPNGWVREAALRHLGHFDVAAALPFVMLRLNDWVEQIRGVARQAIEAWIDVRHAEALIDWYPVLDRVRGGRRASHHHVADKVAAVLADPAAEPALRRGFASTHRVIRRACAQLALARGLPWALDAAFASPDPAVRLWATRGGLESALRTVVIERGLTDPTAAIRLECLRLAGLAPLERALLDRNQSVRELVRHRLRTEHGYNLGAHYRAAVAARRKLPVALLGLAEVGDQGDIATLQSFLSDEKPSVRRAAVRGLDWMGTKVPGEPFVPLLADAAPSVSRQACRALMTRMTPSIAFELDELIGSDLSAHGIDQLARLYLALGGWSAPERLLILARRTDLDAVVPWLEKWTLRYLSSPPPPSVRAAFDAVKDRLPVSLRELLAFILK